MNLKSKKNGELVAELKTLVERERKLLIEILHYLREVEFRKLHLEMGYPDLYEFATKELGYSSGAAYRRVTAMKLMRAVPEVEAKLQTGELCLANAATAQGFFRRAKSSVEEKRQVVQELLGKSTREAQRILMEKMSEAAPPQEKLRPIAGQKTAIQFVASPELMEKLEKLKHLLAHQNFEGRMDQLIEILANMALKKLDSNASSSSAPRVVARQKAGTRYIRVAERRKVLHKNPNGCSYRDPKTGRRCGSKHGLQFDHMTPVAWGGENTAANLTLLCAAHNRYRAERMDLSRKPDST